MGEEAEGEEIEAEEKGKEVVEVDSKVGVATVDNRVLNTLQTRVARGDSTTPRTTQTSRVAREDPNINPRTISRPGKEVQGIRTT